MWSLGIPIIGREQTRTMRSSKVRISPMLSRRRASRIISGAPFSTSPNVSVSSNAVHSKGAEFGDMLASRRAIGVPATCFIPGFYMSNFGGGIPSDLVKASHPDKASTLAAPIVATSPISVLHTSDTGAFIQAKVLHLDDVLGKRLLGATAYLAVQEIPDTFKRVYPEAGATARLFQVPEDISRGFMAAQGLPGAGHLRVVRKCQDA